MRLLRFIKRLFLTMLLLGVLFLTFIFRLMQAALSWFIGHVGLVFLLFLFIVLCYYAKKVSE
jgi:uncharacterized membrane protein